MFVHVNINTHFYSRLFWKLSLQQIESWSLVTLSVLPVQEDILTLKLH